MLLNTAVLRVSRGLSAANRKLLSRPVAASIISRSVSTTKERSLVKFKKLQADFQCEDGRPIWLKGGFCDRLLYSITVIACCVGVFMVFANAYDNGKPPSWKTRAC